MSLKLRLKAMMFLQYAIWGSWAPVLGKYLDDAGYTGNQAGIIFSILPLATALTPILAGQLADRYFATERILGISHLAGGAAMFWMARAEHYSGIVISMLVFSALYAPTIALTNSICFSNLQQSEKEFGEIRVWGTLGWIAAGYSLSVWRSASEVKGDLLYLSGIFAILLGIFSFVLPHTPPKKEGTNPFAFLQALALFNNRNFAVFMAISFVVGTELEFYYLLTSEYLGHLGVSNTSIPAIMTIAQIAEIFVMAVMLPKLLPCLGARKLLSVGVMAWPIRYAIFAIGTPLWLVIASLSLHGFCFVFFFVVGFIYVDQMAPKDIKASAQSLAAIVVLGLGRFIGSRFAGKVKDVFTSGSSTDWAQVFLVPCVLTVLCAIAFLALFRDSKDPQPI